MTSRLCRAVSLVWNTPLPASENRLQRHSAACSAMPTESSIKTMQLGARNSHQCRILRKRRIILNLLYVTLFCSVRGYFRDLNSCSQSHTIATLLLCEDFPSKYLKLMEAFWSAESSHGWPPRSIDQLDGGNVWWTHLIHRVFCFSYIHYNT